MTWSQRLILTLMLILILLVAKCWSLQILAPHSKYVLPSVDNSSWAIHPHPVLFAFVLSMTISFHDRLCRCGLRFFLLFIIILHSSVLVHWHTWFSYKRRDIPSFMTASSVLHYGCSWSWLKKRFHSHSRAVTWWYYSLAFLLLYRTPLLITIITA